MGLIVAAFALVAYIYFFWSLPLAATGFMVNLSHSYPELAAFFPYNIDYNSSLHEDFNMRLALNAALLAVFAVPHSIFARQAVKARIGIPSVYRSLYVFKSAASLHLLLKFWQPLDETKLWEMSDPRFALAGYSIGWLWLVTSTFALDHTELFGLKDAFGVDFMGIVGLGLEDGRLAERAHYSLCRHPIMYTRCTRACACTHMTRKRTRTQSRKCTYSPHPGWASL